jgi:hypothetical protein
MKFLRTYLSNVFESWGQDLINGICWASIISWLKYFASHFVDIGWSVACAIITTYFVHKYKKWQEKKDKNNDHKGSAN